MKLVTMKRLNRALDDVRRELDRVQVWTEKIARVDVYLVPVGCAYGWKWDGSSGHISIPAVSTARFGYVMFGSGFYYSLRDTLRHEYGHAYADVYRPLTRNRSFVRTFGESYDNRHIPYAQQPCELFAETFADYVRKQGRGDPNCPQWRFVRGMVDRIATLH